MKRPRKPTTIHVKDMPNVAKVRRRRTVVEEARFLIHRHDDDKARAARYAKRRVDSHPEGSAQRGYWWAVWRLVSRWQKGVPDGDRRWKRWDRKET